MENLAVFDRKDYDPSLPRVIRDSVRAIIRKGDGLALLYSEKYAMYVFPGGRIEEGETMTAALIRETKEETGLTVRPRTIREYGSVTEIRRDMKAEGIFEQRDFFFTCEAEEGIAPQELSAGEKESGYRLAFVPIDEAILINEREIGSGRRFSERETFLLRHLRAAGK